VLGDHVGESQVNRFRAANGLPALSWDRTMYQKALAWSHHLGDAGALSHSLVSAGMPAGWTNLGENVAWNSSLAEAFTALENSPPHRANLLGAHFSRLAVAVVLQGGRYWVTEEFFG
jgi:uncharacterized protein YkwD